LEAGGGAGVVAGTPTLMARQPTPPRNPIPTKPFTRTQDAFNQQALFNANMKRAANVSPLA
jgi:hypothetical protein